MSSSISMMEARLPPGFRFHPRDDELVLDYLCRKISGKGGAGIDMVDVDLNKCEPWELPAEACVGGREWYVFSLHDRKYATGQRTNRATRSGYWKATGKDRPILRSGAGAVVGMRKTLVFYRGRAPRGSKTEWVMHEFRVEGPAASSSPFKEDWVLCRVFCRSRDDVTAPRKPASADVNARSLSKSNELISLPMPHTPPVVDAHLLAFDDATVGGYYYQQDDDDADGLPAAQAKSLSSFRELLTGMVVERDDDGEGAKVELHHQGWTEAAHAQQAWNPFLSSG